MFTNAQLYGRTYDKVIENNEQEIAEIERYVNELNSVRENLESNKKHLFRQIMLPLHGGKALIKAKLVHTNEIMVYLGDKWFVQTSADRAMDICERKIERCNENIVQIRKETAKFSSNVTKSQELEIFPCNEYQEIIEPYDEEKEKLWREEYKKKVREYKQAEAAVRNISDMEYTRRLEELERKEELQNELNTSKPLSGNEYVEETEIDAFMTKNSKKRVSFSNLEAKLYSPAETILDEDINIIRFAHTSNEPHNNECENTSQTNSPANIYHLYLQNLHPRSILKKDKFKSMEPKSTTNPHEPLQNIEDVSSVAHDDNMNKIFGNIVERTYGSLPQMEKQTRAISKFKKSRVAMSHR